MPYKILISMHTQHPNNDHLNSTHTLYLCAKFHEGTLFITRFLSMFETFHTRIRPMHCCSVNTARTNNSSFHHSGYGFSHLIDVVIMLHYRLWQVNIDRA